MKTLLLIITITIAVFSQNDSAKANKGRTIAIMEFKNHGPAEYDDFLRGVPDMMMTNIGAFEGLRVIERVQIEKAVKAFRMENEGLTAANSVKIGEWLGADILVFGSMIKSGRTIRFDARFIEASSGQQLAGSSVTGEENRVIFLIDELCTKIGERFTGNYKSELVVEAKPVPVVAPPVLNGNGFIRIKFKMYCSLLAEERYYHQKCKVYVDGREANISEKIDRLNVDYEIYNGEVKAGSHSVEVVHYYLNKNGEMARTADEQPRVFLIRVTDGETTTINYKLKIRMEDQKIEYETKAN
ncbi:MAG: hypothetical protein JNL74_21735 [Fibrobacteres bacterium]|nr:hypothetical protein [Fibrobacterota bacterium]